jgi:cell division protein FtsQ
MSSLKFSWKKLLLAVIWTSVGAMAIVLLVAAAHNQKGKVCKDVIVTIKGIDGIEYVSKKQILNTISGGKPELMKGRLIKTFDLQQLEDLLETNLWIRNAELFFDNNDVLRADITEREPVARVFMTNGQSFYIDDMGEQLPVTNDQIARVPVFTAFPNETTAARIKDSVLQQQVKEVGKYILRNEFWMAQIDQVNINNYEFELIPKLGKHTILLGDGTMLPQKLNRVMLFYKKIMSKTGWNYYSALDVRYNQQLVAVRRDSISLFKSFTVEQNQFQINTTIDSNRLQTNDTVSVRESKQTDSTNKSLATGTYQTKPSSSEPVLKSEPPIPQTSQNPNALKNQLPTPAKPTESKPKNTKAPVAKPKVTSEEENILNEAKSQAGQKTQTKKEPKAVMKKNQ